ncbi:MAG: SUMF1/EgtB/PvdO family nonheme iron enzyme, partial [Ferruginibacter sp.]
ENAISPPPTDAYDKVLSIREAVPPTDPKGIAVTAGFLKVSGGNYNFVVKHAQREGDCYPDMDAPKETDYRFVQEKGFNYIIHHHSQQLADFNIMPGVVTNGQFQTFLLTSHYQPANKDNFLKHWNGKSCPENIIDQPVVYVSLQDARAYATWAKMRLPTEWEWQAAAETLDSKFIFNKVWEWNESERNDGYNRFVTLRGGCEHWQLKTSRWYFGGGTSYFKNAPGGKQPIDFHCKYFLMYEGIDRASTLGFRCLAL